MENKAQMWQAIKFTLFSVSAGVIQIGSFALLELLIEGYWIPYLTSLLLSILWSFPLLPDTHSHPVSDVSVKFLT